MTTAYISFSSSSSSSEGIVIGVDFTRLLIRSPLLRVVKDVRMPFSAGHLARDSHSALCRRPLDRRTTVIKRHDSAPSHPSVRPSGCFSLSLHATSVRVSFPHAGASDVKRVPTFSRSSESPALKDFRQATSFAIVVGGAWGPVRLLAKGAARPTDRMTDRQRIRYCYRVRSLRRSQRSDVDPDWSIKCSRETGAVSSRRTERLRRQVSSVGGSVGRSARNAGLAWPSRFHLTINR